MQINIKKGIQSLSTLTCIRTDGTYTSGKLQPGLEYHDIAHYVVEKNLRFGQGFYGMVNNGINIEDFILPIKSRPEKLMPKNLPMQSIQTEYIVNQLMLMTMQQYTTGFMATLTNTLMLANIPYPHELNESKLQTILADYSLLMDQWKALNENEKMSFDF